MHLFSAIISDLLAAIAKRAARDRALTALLVALCFRVAQMRTRLERLIARWRAGERPRVRAARTGQVSAPGGLVRRKFPAARGWLLGKLGYEVAVCGAQLRNLLSEAECVEFLAAFPQAGRILRPLLGMLTADPLPAVIRLAPVARRVVLPAAAGVVIGVGSQFLDI